MWSGVEWRVEEEWIEGGRHEQKGSYKSSKLGKKIKKGEGEEERREWSFNIITTAHLSFTMETERENIERAKKERE